MCRWSRATVLSVIILLSLVPSSGRSSYGPNPHTSNKIPQEAYDACKEKSAGESVIVTVRRGIGSKQVKAICSKYDDEKQLLAVPEHLLEVPDSTSPRHGKDSAQQ